MKASSRLDLTENLLTFASRAPTTGRNRVWFKKTSKREANFNLLKYNFQKAKNTCHAKKWVKYTSTLYSSH
jgi:hypothetical protein